MVAQCFPLFVVMIDALNLAGQPPLEQFTAVHPPQPFLARSFGHCFAFHIEPLILTSPASKVLIESVLLVRSAPLAEEAPTFLGAVVTGFFDPPFLEPPFFVPTLTAPPVFTPTLTSPPAFTPPLISPPAFTPPLTTPPFLSLLPFLLSVLTLPASAQMITARNSSAKNATLRRAMEAVMLTSETGVGE
ncbi:unnamed protein product [Closterium sp. NIES-54]